MAADRERPGSAKTLGKLVLALLVTGVLAAGIAMPLVLGGGLVAKSYAAKFLDTPCTWQPTQPPQPTTLYANDRKTVIARLFTQDRKPVALAKVPSYLQDALTATEDRRFYTHHGVDLRGILRSAVSTTNGDTQGGSTLTMQYVKQSRYYQAGDDIAKQNAAIAVTLNRKIEDAKCAIDIEGARHEPKRKILEDYLNIAFFGEHAYGIEKAAETYFGTSTSGLTLGQSAVLVGLLRAPSYYDPFLHPVAAKARRNEVLQNLVSVGKLSQARANAEKAKPISLATRTPPRIRQGCGNSASTIRNVAFFCQYAINWLKSVNGLTDSQLQTGGLKIITTLSARVQNTAQRRINQAIPATSPMTAVLPALDPRNGDVLAMVSSKSFGSKGTTETEQPIFTLHAVNGASTFKLFPLLTALSIGIPSDWKLDTVGSTGTYVPKYCFTKKPGASNGDENIAYNPIETLATATAKSSNTYFLSLADNLFNCNLDPIVSLMQKMGMTGLALHDPGDDPRLTYAQVVTGQQRAQQLVLGSIPTSALELAGAYAAVASYGVYNTPAPIQEITDPAGKSIRVRRSPGVRVLPPQVAASAIDILTGDTRPGGSAASRFTDWYASNGSLIAGKTGTNAVGKKNTSVWFAGMTPRLVSAAGLINFDSSSAPSPRLPGAKPGDAYGDYAAKLWIGAFQGVLQSRDWTWTQPTDVAGKDVPVIRGLTLSAANRRLTAAGFRMQVFDAADSLRCPSSAALDTIGYYAPQRATTGSTITVCQSSSVPQYAPPVVHRPVQQPVVIQPGPIPSAQPVPTRQRPVGNRPNPGRSSTGNGNRTSASAPSTPSGRSASSAGHSSVGHSSAGNGSAAQSNAKPKPRRSSASG